MVQTSSSLADPIAVFAGFAAQTLRFQAEARTLIEVPSFKGSSLRGGLQEGLGRSLGHDHATSEAQIGCPICYLTATFDATGDRGADVPRPFAIRAPLESIRRYDPGQQFEFGLTLFGHAIDLYPYAVLGALRLGEVGWGRRDQAPGRFDLTEIWAENQVTGEARRIYQRTLPTVRAPDLAVTHAQVVERARSHGESPSKLRVRFLTPTRLVQAGNLVQQITLEVMLRRIFRRLTDLGRAFGDGPPRIDFQPLLDRTREVKIVQDETRWVDLTSHGRRHGRSTPIGGHVGSITFAGDLAPFVPWLIWGEVIQIGKDATKGNGRYVIEQVE